MLRRGKWWQLVTVLTGMWAAVGAAHAQKKPVRLAVMDFTSAATSSEYAPLGVGLQSMITTDLGNVGTLVLVERARLKDLQAELKLQDSGAVDSETAAKLGGLAGASHLLVGSFTVVGGKMRLDARMFVVQSGEVLFGEKMEGAEAQFFELEKQLVNKIVTTVGAKLSKKEKADLQKPQTQDYEAFQKFSQGIALWDQKKQQESIAALRAAVAKDPNFTLAALRLQQFEAMAPQAKPPEVKPPEAKQASCEQNPLQQPSCSPPPGVSPPPEYRAPTTVIGDGKRPISMIVHSGGVEVPCTTPCQLHLPKGPVELEVISPTRYRMTLEAPGGPAAIEVSRLNKTNIIIGSVLAGLTLAMVGATVGLHEHKDTYSTGDPGFPTTGSSPSTASQYWPVTLSLATGMAFPAIYYLLQMGRNKARIVAR